MFNNYNAVNHDPETSKQSQICMEYHQQLIPEFVDTTKKNISLRVTEMIFIINRNEWISSKSVEFTINIPQIVIQAMAQITPIIQNNTLVDISACKKVPQSKEDYRKIARNRLNRNKPKFVGNFVFGPLIFERLYHFCLKVFGDYGVSAFVSILSDILAPESLIRFKQTRAQPLIPYNTFVCDNAFRNSCVMLLRHYGLEQEWKNPNKNKLNAKNKWHTFRTKCMPQLVQKCNRNNYRAPRCLFIAQRDSYTTKTPIIPDAHYFETEPILEDAPIAHSEYHNNDCISTVDMQSDVQLEQKVDDEYVTEYGCVHGNPMPPIMIQAPNLQTSAPNSTIFSPHSLDTIPSFRTGLDDNNDPNFCVRSYNSSVNRVNCNPFNNPSNNTFQRNVQMSTICVDHNVNNNRFYNVVNHPNNNSNYYRNNNNCSFSDLDHTNTFVDDRNVNNDEMDFYPWNKEDDYDETGSLCAFALDPSLIPNYNESVMSGIDDTFDMNMN